jgi:hypothetical protein
MECNFANQIPIKHPLKALYKGACRRPPKKIRLQESLEKSSQQKRKVFLESIEVITQCNVNPEGRLVHNLGAATEKPDHHRIRM